MIGGPILFISWLQSSNSIRIRPQSGPRSRIDSTLKEHYYQDYMAILPATRTTKLRIYVEAQECLQNMESFPLRGYGRPLGRGSTGNFPWFEDIPGLRDMIPATCGPVWRIHPSPILVCGILKRLGKTVRTF